MKAKLDEIVVFIDRDFGGEPSPEGCAEIPRGGDSPAAGVSPRPSALRSPARR